MKLSEVSVRRGVTFLMLYIMIVGFGIFSLMRLGLDLYPDISFPVVITIVQYEGANPEDIETLVTRPLESAVASVDGVESITSESKQGVSLVVVEFDWGTDMEQAETDVRRAIEMIEGIFGRRRGPDDLAFDPSAADRDDDGFGPYPSTCSAISRTRESPLVERIDGGGGRTSGGLVRGSDCARPAQDKAYKLDVTAVMGAVYARNNQQSVATSSRASLSSRSRPTASTNRSGDRRGRCRRQADARARCNPIRLKEVASIVDGFAESGVSRDRWSVLGLADHQSSPAPTRFRRPKR